MLLIALAAMVFRWARAMVCRWARLVAGDSDSYSTEVTLTEVTLPVSRPLAVGSGPVSGSIVDSRGDMRSPGATLRTRPP